MSKFTNLLFNSIAQQSNRVANAADRLLARIVPEESAEATFCYAWQQFGCCYKAGHLYKRYRRRCWNPQAHSWYYQYFCSNVLCQG
jgi:hypothetical protein